jgi:hypothetical protein
MATHRKTENPGRSPAAHLYNGRSKLAFHPKTNYGSEQVRGSGLW